MYCLATLVAEVIWFLVVLRSTSADFSQSECSLWACWGSHMLSTECPFVMSTWDSWCELSCIARSFSLALWEPNSSGRRIPKLREWKVKTKVNNMMHKQLRLTVINYLFWGTGSPRRRLKVGTRSICWTCFFENSSPPPFSNNGLINTRGVFVSAKDAPPWLPTSLIPWSPHSTNNDGAFLCWCQWSISL